MTKWFSLLGTIVAVAIFLLLLPPNLAFGLCGDADDNSVINLSDLVEILHWLAHEDPLAAGFDQADADDYDIVTIRDVAYLVAYEFAGGDAPVCPPTLARFVPVPDPDFNVTYTGSFPAGVTDFDVEIFITNSISTTPAGISLPMMVRVGGAVPTSLLVAGDTTWPGAVVSGSNLVGGPAANGVLLGFSPSPFAPGTREFGHLYITMPTASATPRSIDLTFTTLPPMQSGEEVNEPMIMTVDNLKSQALLSGGIPLLTPVFLCGDADGSGNVSIADAVYLINYIFGGGPAPLQLLQGDPNCDGSISVGDAVYLINFIFGGGQIPCATCP